MGQVKTAAKISMRRKIASTIRPGLFVTGVGLLLLLCFGLFVKPLVPSEPQSERDLPGYNFVLREVDELMQAFEKPAESFDLVSANQLVFESMVHADDRRFEICENWIMWLVGLVYQPASRIRRADRLAQGRSGSCKVTKTTT